MLPTPIRQILILTALACCLLAAAPAAGGAARPARVRVGSAPELPPGAETAGSLAESRELNLVVGLEPRDPAALAQFAEAVSTPGSPQFRQYLGVGEFAARFAPSEAQIAAVRASLEAQGLEVGPTPANHLTLPVSGTPSAVEAAFATPLEKVLLPATASAPNGSPTERRAAGARRRRRPLRPGRGRARRPHPLRIPRRSAPADRRPDALRRRSPKPTNTSTKAGAPTRSPPPTAFPQLYAAGNLGAGQTRRPARATSRTRPPTSPTYQSCYGTSTEVTEVNVDGGPGTERRQRRRGGARHRAGDRPRAGAHVARLPGARTTARPTSKRLDGDGQPEPGQVDLDLVGRLRGSRLERHHSIENTLLEEAAAQGQSFFAASGDDGSEDCSKTNEKHRAGGRRPGQPAVRHRRRRHHA